MNIYLAAQFKEQMLMREWRRLLQDAGHIVTSRWLGEDAIVINSKLSLDAGMIDLEDIDKAEIVISHTLSRGDLFTGGGRHIEFGYALAKGKRLINVGGWENVFHSQAKTVDTIEEAISILNEPKQNGYWGLGD